MSCPSASGIASPPHRKPNSNHRNPQRLVLWCGRQEVELHEPCGYAFSYQIIRVARTAAYLPTQHMRFTRALASTPFNSTDGLRRLTPLFLSASSAYLSRPFPRLCIHTHVRLSVSIFSYPERNAPRHQAVDSLNLANRGQFHTSPSAGIKHSSDPKSQEFKLLGTRHENLCNFSLSLCALTLSPSPAVFSQLRWCPPSKKQRTATCRQPSKQQQHTRRPRRRSGPPATPAASRHPPFRSLPRAPRRPQQHSRRRRRGWR